MSSLSVPKNLSELHPLEQALILAIRVKYRYGDITVITRDGLPFRMKVTERFEDLSKLLDTLSDAR